MRLLKHWYKEQTMQIKWGKHFSELFHVSNGVRQGGVLSQYLFTVYLDDLSDELNNSKAECYIGEVLLNHLMFADDICVLCPSVRWLQRILHVCQAYAESHGIIFNYNKTVCMTLKAKSAKSTATLVLKLGGQYVKSVDQYKYLGILLHTELSDDKDIPRQLRYQYCAANKLRASFSRCSNAVAVENVLFRYFCTPMYASQLWCNFRKSCMQRLRVAYNFGCRALYNLPSNHQVQCNIPTFEALLRKYKCSGNRLIHPRLMQPTAYYIQIAWHGIFLILFHYKTLVNTSSLRLIHPVSIVRASKLFFTLH